MTPEEARALLDGTTPGPWEVDHDHAWEPSVWSPDCIVFGPYYDREDMEQWEAGNAADLRLAAAAPVLAALAAGMHEEWGVHVTGYPKNIADWAELCDSPEDHITWLPDEEAAEDFAVEREDDGFDTRIVRRYVTEPEEA